MVKMAPQCIVCGKGESFFSRLCQQCYLEKHPILKQKKDLHITVCERCELLFIKGHWTNFYAVDIGTPSINSNLSMFLSQEWSFHYRPKKVQIREASIELDVEGYISAITGVVDISASPDAFVPLMTISEDFMVHIDWGECSECRARLIGSYSSKIQIRSPREVNIEQLETWSAEIEKLSQSYPLTDGKNPLFKINFLKSGIDALFQTRAAANSVGRIFAKRNGGIISVTTEFAGFDKSKSKEFPRKPVVLITLPEFNPGDIVILTNQPIQILRYNDKVEFWDFQRKTKEKFPIKSFLALKPQRIEEEECHYQLLNFEQKGKIAQIMNNKTFDTHYIDSNDVSDLSEGATFKGTLYNGRLLRKQKKT